MSGLIAFKPSPERDPDGSKLRALLSFHLEYERRRGIRHLLVYLLAASSLGLGIRVFGPDLLPGGLLQFVLSLWVMSLVGLPIIGLAEWSCHRRRAQLIKELEPSGTKDAP